MKIDAVADVAGRPLAAVEMRHGEVRPCKINCEKLLREFEMLVSVKEAHTAGLTVHSSYVREGTSGEIVLQAPWPIKDSFKEYPLEVLVNTTMGVVSAAVLVRVYGVS